mmetsp:Transcript_106242/g.300449  ORF Transcript_106242/g.300449 Transcript_106242/m.300449 type:complete len:134 (+) Transcript_106242:79-480(+)
MGDSNQHHLWWQERILKERLGVGRPRAASMRACGRPKLRLNSPVCLSSAPAFSSTAPQLAFSGEVFTPRVQRSRTPGPLPAAGKIGAQNSAFPDSAPIHGRADVFGRTPQSYIVQADVHEVVQRKSAGSLRWL